MTVIAISNSATSDNDLLDDRVRSRMGSAAEISFGAYSKSDVLALLQEKASQASVVCEPGALEYCAQACSDEHSDARRAIELFRAACEVAGLQGQEKLQKAHVDAAEAKLQKDRVVAAVAGSSYHMRIAYAALARVTYLTGEEWHSTSVLYSQYCMMLQKQARPLTYRRVSEILSELVNAGLATSATMSWGRPGGYGTRYRLTAPAELVGGTCLPESWKEIEGRKRKRDEEVRQTGQRRFEAAMSQSLQDSFYSKPRVLMFRNMEEQEKAGWERFVGMK
jgi:Cdc6-like AAA superfamily ATPase